MAFTMALVSLRATLLVVVCLLGTLTAQARGQFRVFRGAAEERELEQLSDVEKLQVAAKYGESYVVELTSTSQSAVAQENVSLNLDCSPWLSQNETIKWTFIQLDEFGNQLGEHFTPLEPNAGLSSRIIVGGSFNQWLNITNVVVIQGAEDPDSKIFICEVCEDRDTPSEICHTSNFTLKVIGAAPILFGPGVYRSCLNRNDNYIIFGLLCTINSDGATPFPIPQRSWYKDGELVYTANDGTLPDASEYILKYPIFMPGVLQPDTLFLYDDGSIFYHIPINIIINYNDLIPDNIADEEAARRYLFNHLLGNWTCFVSNNLGNDSFSNIITDCGCPPLQPPTNGMLLVHSLTISEDSSITIQVTFQCNKGYNPRDIRTANCLENGMWSDDPASLDCTDINECAESPCPQDTPCFNTDGSYTCGCGVGYFYAYAKSDVTSLNACIDVDECVFGENDCNENATCKNTNGSFTCECDPGYTGDGRWCIPVDDPCSCDVSSTHCILSTEDLSTRCACDRGYYLHLSGTCIDINECSVTEYNDLICEYGTCVNTKGSFTCECSAGYMSNVHNNCEDINECSVVNYNDCDVDAECTNTMGSFTCECPTEYFGNGRSCELGIGPIINTANLRPAKPNVKLEYNIGTSFCIEDPVNTSVQFTVTCTLEELGVPTPDLQLNIFLDGTNLDSNNSNISIMILSTNNYAGNVTFNDIMIVEGTIQMDSQSTLLITCMVNNTFGTDTATTSIRLCDIDECQEGVTNNCTQGCARDSISGDHQCSCGLGYDLVGGTTCEDMNECNKGLEFHNCSRSKNQKCENLHPPDRYRCKCITGYHSIDGGDTCEDINECSFPNITCPQYSKCKNTNGSYDCECVSGTKMDSLDGMCKDVNECDPDLGLALHNCNSSDNRECINLPPPEQYTCECMEGYQSPDGGNFCEDIDECSLSNYTCSFITECRNTIGSYTCTLTSGFISGITLTTVFLVVVIIITVLIIMCYSRLKRTIVAIFKRKPKKQEAVTMSAINETPNISKRVMMRGSIKSKLSTLITISSADLKVEESIGQGEFAIVYKGYFTCHNNKELVAIKTLKGFIEESAIEELLQECARMAAFEHPHVMSLIGVCLDGGPVPYIVLPYMANGSLLTYLKKERHRLVIESEDEELLVFTRKRLMDMCLQVARGMEYLTRHKIVHRDLAARNCMIDMNMMIKVADFGLSENTGSKLYFRVENAVDLKLPVMWMAPESLMDYIFSEKSDIWSYGVTCWEVFSGGQAPYAGARPSSILKLLQSGERLGKPSNSACSSDLYAMMLSCWEMEPDNRPTFSYIESMLSESLEEMADYFNVGAFTELDS